MVLAVGIVVLLAMMPRGTITAAVIDNGQAGYSESGSGWQYSARGGYGGSSRIHVAGSGDEKAGWQLSGLAASTYNIQATWAAWSNRASNSPYRIYDGATWLQTVRVDQRQAPKGSSINGYPFQVLTTVKITSGTLTITLADDADGVLSADAVAISTTTAVTQPTLLREEVVANGVATTNGANSGNPWGANKLRVIRTSNDTVYTAYLTATSLGDLHKQWNLAKRNSDGTWSVVATGMAGREPVNLLQGPQDQIYLVSWDGGLPSLTTSTDGVHFSTQAIPGAWTRTDWPYSSAGISPSGDLYVLAVESGTSFYQPGKSDIAWRTAADGQWHFTTYNTDYRYCYDFLFPGTGGQLQLVGARDVAWSTMGWTPAGGDSYVYDGLMRYDTTNITTQSFQGTFLANELPTANYPYVTTSILDAYVDTAGKMHTLYVRNGADTGGRNIEHEVISQAGQVLADVTLPDGFSWHHIIQSPTSETLYLIDAQGKVYPAGSDGTQLGTPVQLNLQGYSASQNGIFLAAPRGGTPLSNIVDGVFQTSSGAWIYVRIQLP